MVDYLTETLTLFPQPDSQVRKESITIIPENVDRKAIALWEKCSEIIKDNVDKQVYRTWFEPIKALKWVPNKLTVVVPSQWFYEWIEAHYYSLMQKTIQRVMGDDAQLLYQVVVDDKKDTNDPVTIKVPGLKFPPNSNTITNSDTIGSNKPFPSNLNPRYVFDNFITGDSNQLAFSAAKAISNNPGGTKFNPLFIYGDSGLGKTHLAQAIGNQIVRDNPKAKVLYTNSEHFTMEFVNAIQNNKVNEFVSFYRAVDVLIVDDIHFLGGKEKTQDNFFHTFNALHQLGKQLILTSDKPPRDLKDLDARLISRFQWGLTVDIQSPDFEMRMAILKRKSEDEGIELPNDVVEFIARHVTSNIRELEGALISLIAKYSFDRKPLNVDLAKEVIIGHCSYEPTPLNIDDIKSLVSSHFKIPIEQMESKSRKHEIALARQMAMYLAKQLTDLSLKNIGNSFGGRDHSTVLHSCQAIDNYIVTDKSVKNSYEILLNKLKSK